MKSKGLFFLCGESFRDGNPVSRLRDTEYGVEKQRECSSSHIHLANHMLQFNVSMDFALHTYTTCHEEMLRGFYPNTVYAKFTEPNTSDIDVRYIVQRGLLSLISSIDINVYSFIFICRFDILLKDSLVYIFNPGWNEIMYPNVMSIADNDFYDTCIASLFVFIPRRFFSAFGSWKGLQYNLDRLLHHHCVQDLANAGLDLDNDIGFMTECIYIANTIQQKNPLYSIHCRPEGPDFVSGCSDRRYDRNTHTVIDRI